MSEVLPEPLQLDPLPYTAAIRDFLQRIDPAVWNWFASVKDRSAQRDETRFELLKSTYRVERETQSSLYDAAEEVAAALGISAPVTIYQAQNPIGLNASMAYALGEVHLVLHGPVASQLSAVEVRALLAHELSHYLLWSGWNGEFLATAEMLGALVNDRRAHAAHFASLRLF